MRYMIIVKGSENLAASGPPPPEMVEAIERHTEELIRNGTLGPFAGSMEGMGGFSMLRVGSKEEALEEARGFTELHRVHWPQWEGEIEIRLMYEAEDDVRATQIEAGRRLEHQG